MFIEPKIIIMIRDPSECIYSGADYFLSFNEMFDNMREKYYNFYYLKDKFDAQIIDHKDLINKKENVKKIIKKVCPNYTENMFELIDSNLVRSKKLMPVPKDILELHQGLINSKNK